jgi:hypothetical protein
MSDDGVQEKNLTQRRKERKKKNFLFFFANFAPLREVFL